MFINKIYFYFRDWIYVPSLSMPQILAQIIIIICVTACRITIL